MTAHWTPEDFGDPQLELAGFKLWVHGVEDEYRSTHRDESWLNVTAHCSANGSSVWAEGSILQVSDLRHFGSGCSRLLEGTDRRAHLPSLERHLSIWLVRTDDLGHFTARVWLTPDPEREVHSFEFELDQTYLPGIVAACDRITREHGSADSAVRARVWPESGDALSPEEEFTASELYLRSMVGRSVEVCLEDSGRWSFVMGAGVQLDVACTWRLLEHGRIKLSAHEAGNSFETGLPADSTDGASKVLAGKRIRGVQLRAGTLDLVIDLGSGFLLEILPTYVRYEAWEFHAPGRMGLIAQGRGTLCLM